MDKKLYTREELLDVLGAYRRLILRDNGEHPEAVLDDIKVSIDFVLDRNNYNGKYADDNKEV